MSYRKSKGIVLLITCLIILCNYIISFLKFYFKGIRKRKLWKEFFFTFSSLVLLNLGYYLFFSNTNIKFFLFSIIPFIIYWGAMFIFCKPEYYNNEWMREEYWRTLNAFQFEEEIAELFRGLGYKAQVTQKTVDFGVDVIVWINNVKTAVQCKRYNGHPATSSEVRDLWGAKEYYNCKGAIMVALDGITRQGQQFINKFENYEFFTMYDIIEKVEEVYTKEKKEEVSNGELYS